ncbi:MAG: ATP-dependent Clp protease ATP-binding subunit [Bacteroidales bacterium]|nr:ATP-dependent Clp protease ATP-binding subunit [Bacteroidales bacterium]
MQLRISPELHEIVGYARDEAMRTGSYSIGTDHLFLGILRHGDNGACRCLSSLGVNLEDFKASLDRNTISGELISYSEIDKVVFSRLCQNALNLTILEATRSRSDTADSRHLLLALLRSSGGVAKTYLSDLGINAKLVAQQFCGEPAAGEAASQRENAEENEAPESGEPTEKGSLLDEFARDLTAEALSGRLDPVVGRDREIERVVEILGRRKKNNPMLIGEPGVGKSAIVEGIALRLASDSVPAPLRGKKLYSLDIASVVAGTRYRGDFEKRIKGLIAELRERTDVILFIDEFHTMVGAGGAQGSLDAANMLKPALARGELQCIGATTMDEFTKIVEKDGALDRRFQKIVVEATDIAQTLEILTQIAPQYEQFHGVRYTKEALEACVRQTDRYIPAAHLPDKAVDAMDEAGSMVRLRGGKTVGVEDIAAVVSKISGIPAGRVARQEGQRLLEMQKRLAGSVIGQDEAVERVCRAICRNRAGLKDPARPIGTFLFFGPTGVGKTKLAKSLASYLFDSEENLIRIDMSEYGEKIASSRLVGAPPGYVGYEEGGQLSEAVRRKPYSVVLLDEIEKAHPDIFNLLLQVLDEGRLTDSNGRTVNFRNTIVIMTSNVGSRDLEDYGGGIGFGRSDEQLEQRRRSMLDKAVRKAFPPEFINRIDEQVFFRSLGRDDLEKIIELELKGLRERAAEAEYRLTVSPAARRFIAQQGYDPAYGARPLRRAITRYVEDPVSEFILSDKLLRRPEGGGAKSLSVVLAPDGAGTAVKVTGRISSRYRPKI